MKVLVTGVGGQLGYDVVQELLKRGHVAIGTDVRSAAPPFSSSDEPTPEVKFCYEQLDITDAEAVSRIAQLYQPDAVVHCAAWTAVDAAEDENNVSTVMRVNVEGTRNLAKAVNAVNAKMIYISTDYVFDGTGKSPWEADCKEYAPINIYGKSKLEGELAVFELLEKFFIVRIAWVFGKNGNNFVKTMLKVGKNHDTLRVVNDQIGTPTYTFDLARLLADMVESEKYGYYHATNEGGYISWYDFACEIFYLARLKQEREGIPSSEQFYKNIKMVPVSTEEYGFSTAARPFNSRLDKSKLDDAGFERLPTWKDALARYIEELDFSKL